jgi:hypothetical protein
MPGNSNTSEQGSTRRMVTRAKNATTHPGAAFKEATRAHRAKEVIQQEKDEKKARKEAEDQRVAKAKAGKRYASRLEVEDVQAVSNNEKKIPRRQQQEIPGRCSSQ